MLLDLSAVSPADIPQIWHILAFFQAAIALISLITKANQVIAQMCRFTGFVSVLWRNVWEKTLLPKLVSDRAYFLCVSQDMVLYVL